MKSIRFILMVCALFLSSCTEQQKEMVHQVKGQFGVMFDLKAMIDKELDDGQSAFHIQNNSALTIRLVNTSYNDKSENEREAKADALCQKVLDFIASYKEMDHIKVIYIAYVNYERKFMIVNFTTTLNVYQYEIEDEKRPGDDIKESESSGRHPAGIQHLCIQAYIAMIGFHSKDACHDLS